MDAIFIELVVSQKMEKINVMMEITKDILMKLLNIVKKSVNSADKIIKNVNNLTHS
jgi:hypothetical protein